MSALLTLVPEDGARPDEEVLPMVFRLSMRGPRSIENMRQLPFFILHFQTVEG